MKIISTLEFRSINSFILTFQQGYTCSPCIQYIIISKIFRKSYNLRINIYSNNNMYSFSFWSLLLEKFCTVDNDTSKASDRYSL